MVAALRSTSRVSVAPQIDTRRILALTEEARQAVGQPGDPAGARYAAALAALGAGVRLYAELQQTGIEALREAQATALRWQSSWQETSRDPFAWYQLGVVYAAKAGEAELRRYLALPLTIYLGQEDTGDKDRNDTPEAAAQGETRYERGRNAFQAGRERRERRNKRAGPLDTRR